MAPTTPIIVIVPGGFFSTKPYDTVRTLLQQAGYQVLVPALTVCGDLSAKAPDTSEWQDMAVRGAKDDVKHIHSLLLPLLDEGRQAVILGHSYGSVPAMMSVQGQTVDERNARGLKGGIVGFVSVAGFAYPMHGKNVYGTDDDPPLMPYHELEAGILHLQDAAKPVFFSDLSGDALEQAWSQVFKTQSYESLRAKPTYIESDMKIAKWYIFCENDETVSPAYQETFIKTGAFDNVVKVPSGHVPFLSIPEKLVDVLNDICSA